MAIKHAPFCSNKKCRGGCWKRARQVTAEHPYDWETLGRLLGAAYGAGEKEFHALLEGFDRGRTNERQGRRAMGGPK